jgi:hypothetical protein
MNTKSYLTRSCAILVLLGTTLAAQAYYNPQTGRWLSRDPIGESGFAWSASGAQTQTGRRTDNQASGIATERHVGDPPYVFVGNNAISSHDFLGLRWKVDRNGNEKASAKPENGDTVAALAPLVGLNSADYRKWLTTVGPTRMPGSPTERITQCGEFKIPNTVVAYWAGALDSFGKWWVYWDRSVAYLHHLGFSVAEYDHVAGQKLTLEGILQPSGAAKKLHGIYFWGHGNRYALYSQSGDAVLRFAHSDLHYKLALGLVFACDSNSGKGQLFSGSAGGIWHGYTGTLVPWWAYHVNIWIRPGDQQTRTTPLLP